MSLPVKRARDGRGGSAFEISPAEPPSATGQYPEPVWTSPSPSPSADAQSYGSSTRASASTRRPQSFGQRPPPRWSRAAGNTRADGGAADSTGVAPPSATGQYPGPVWAPAQPPLQTSPQPTSPQPLPLAKASRASRGFTAPSEASPGYPAHFKEPGYSDDMKGVVPAGSATEASTVVLTNEAIYRIVREVAVADSGEAAYAAISADQEFSTPGNPAFQRRQFGLGFGLLLSTQETGRLGRVLALTRQRDPAAFAEALGAEAEIVLAVTTASTPEQRLQPVGGEPLWSPGWAERFRALGRSPACHYAQNEEAIEGLFRPMWNVAEGIGIISERGLALLFDRVVVGGLGEGLRWALGVAGPFRTAEQRTFALGTLGFQTIRDFQAAVPGLTPDGNFGAETYGALVAALRAQGRVSLPEPSDYEARLLSAAQGGARARLSRLRDSAVLTETFYRAS